ncbi:hypothetical protein FHS23_004588 [Prauserella isguenensis]|uniref:ATP-binding protein n=1 Tax=Prauserella isguenensis TaxID=1470180 RepID=A0A839S838_9PSEU|nr:hypothetical protein [Prauserella isguenensis]MBB3053534.1 hypothetical protein [Prauserella isguenensis]
MSDDQDPRFGHDDLFTDSGADTLHITVNGTTDELSSARDLLRYTLADLPEEFVIDALLVADELITDTLRSSGGPALLHVRRTNGGYCLQIEVTTLGAKPPTVSLAEASQGLQVGRIILEQLAANWGVEQNASSTTTWAALDIPPVTVTKPRAST